MLLMHGQFSPRSGRVAIDFGTCHTVVSVRRGDGRIHQLLFDGSPQLLSAVSLNADGSLIVGSDAVHDGRRRPECLEPHPKRRIDADTVLLGDRELPTRSLIAAVLGRAKREIDQTLGTPEAVVITVPADWGPTRRQALADAAHEAGLGAFATVHEPVAAATYFAVALGNEVPIGNGVVVYDLGGGTFDATVLQRHPHGFEVAAVEGDRDLGGVDIDQALAEHLAATASPDDERWQRLREPQTTADRRHRIAWLEEVRQAKERLSRQASVELTVPLLDLDVHLTRDELETVARPLLQRTVRIAQGVIRESGLRPDQLTALFLVGAASRMPLVATMLHQELGIAPATIEQPELAVSEGALNAVPLTQTTPQPQFLPPAHLTPAPAPAQDPALTPAYLHAAPGYQPSQQPDMTTPPPFAGPGPYPAPRRPFGAWLRSTTGIVTSIATVLAVIGASFLISLGLNDLNDFRNPDDGQGDLAAGGDVDPEFEALVADAQNAADRCSGFDPSGEGALAASDGSTDGIPAQDVYLECVQLSAPDASSGETCAYAPLSGSEQTPQDRQPAAGTQEMTIVTNLGVVEVGVDTAGAPCTAGSFTFLAMQGYFDGQQCHRLVTDGIWVLQCGDPDARAAIEAATPGMAGTGSPGYMFGDENLPNETEANYPAGTFAMANAGPGTTGSQFFIVYEDTTLPAAYTILGEVTSGMDIVDQVAAAGAVQAF
jgi:cyclophilin family peptidyl-prolyl cis-trans isomerase/Ethanolamine utilization protein EutJ (predicted chaperonin)